MFHGPAERASTASTKYIVNLRDTKCHSKFKLKFQVVFVPTAMVENPEIIEVFLMTLPRVIHRLV